MQDFDGGRSRPEGRGPPLKSERRPPGKGAPPSEGRDDRQISNRARDGTASAPAQASSPSAALAALRQQRQVQALHDLGPRALHEFLVELGRHHPGIAADGDRLLAKYAAADPLILRALGGDKFPPAAASDCPVSASVSELGQRGKWGLMPFEKWRSCARLVAIRGWGAVRAHEAVGGDPSGPGERAAGIGALAEAGGWVAACRGFDDTLPNPHDHTVGDVDEDVAAGAYSTWLGRTP